MTSQTAFMSSTALPRSGPPTGQTSTLDDVPLFRTAPTPGAGGASPDRPRRLFKPKAIPDVSALPDDALLCPDQLARLSGFTIHALKKWRREKKGQGPRVIYVEVRPRTTVRDFRLWIGAAA